MSDKLSTKAKRAKLAIREKKIREELDHASDKFEANAKKVLTIAAISGVTLLVSYGIFRWVSSGKEKLQPQKIIKTAAKKSSFRLPSVLVERLSVFLIKIVSDQITSVIKKLKEKHF
jgi:hypothetical protein